MGESESERGKEGGRCKMDGDMCQNKNAHKRERKKKKEKEQTKANKQKRERKREKMNGWIDGMLHFVHGDETKKN